VGANLWSVTTDDIDPPRRASPSRPTLNTVAERAGVSKSLVSMVMRNAPYVSQAKRDAVTQAAAELGYRPNRLARSLVERRSNTVGIVISDMENPYWIGILRAMQDKLEESGMRVLLGDAHRNPGRDAALVDAFLGLRVDALCLMGARIRTPALEVAIKEAPTVVIAEPRLRERGVDLVLIDDDAGMRMVVEHLVGLGHKRIAMIANPAGTSGQARAEAYAKAMLEHGLDKWVTIEPTDGSQEGSHQAGLNLLSLKRRPTAIATESDFSSTGVLTAAYELGIDVPSQLSVTGYDNTLLAEIPQLSLTSVDLNSSEVGSTAAQFLLSRIEDPALRRRERRIRPKLVQRRSTQKLIRRP
jgi:DNA-binding LacI/PurR family transcriptional regulator